LKKIINFDVELVLLYSLNYSIITEEKTMKITLLTFSLLLLISCGGPQTRSGSTEEFDKEEPDMPWFVMKPPSSPDSLYGVGFAKKQNPMLGKKAATQRARDEISQSVKLQVETLMRDFMSESGIGENAQALEYTESVSNQVTANTLEGSIILHTARTKDGTWYVLVGYSIDSVRNATLEAAKKEEALFNEFKANQGFDRLESAIKNMKQ